MMELQFYKKKEDAFDSALFAMSEFNYLSLSETKDNNAPILQSHHNPEKYTIQKDLLEKLGNDAKHIIKQIYELNPKICTPSTGNITKTSIRNYLQQKHWGSNRMQKAFNEIKEYTNYFE